MEKSEMSDGLLRWWDGEPSYWGEIATIIGLAVAMVVIVITARLVLNNIAGILLGIVGLVIASFLIAGLEVGITALWLLIEHGGQGVTDERIEASTPAAQITGAIACVLGAFASMMEGSAMGFFGFLMLAGTSALAAEILVKSVV